MPPLSGSRSCGTKFAGKGFVLRSYIKISDTGVFGIPRSASSSHTVRHRSLLIAVRTCSIFSGVLVSGLPEHGSLSTDSQASSKHLCHTFICATFIASSLKAFWIIWMVSAEESSILTQNWMQICCSTCSVILNVMATQCTCSLNTVYHPHWLRQWSCHCSHMCDLSPLALAARLHQRCTNCSHYIINGWTFSGQTFMKRGYSNKPFYS